MITVTLCGLNNMLEYNRNVGVTAQVVECGGLDRIEALQNHNMEIHQPAFDIIDRYFSGDAEVRRWCG